MAEIRGKFIINACDLIKTKPEARQEAIKRVQDLTGKSPYELDPEGWYDTKVVQAVFSSILDHTDEIMGWAAIKVIGQLAYPTIKNTVGLPPELKTPLDIIKFDAQGFLSNHRGPDLVPRKFIQEQDQDIIIEAPSPGYDCGVMEGVYEGILHVCGVGDGRVRQTQCVKKGDSTCVYRITWSGRTSYTAASDWAIRGPK
jgi:hypothetical protein